MNYSEFIKQCDELIRIGKSSAAAKRLLTLELEKIPRGKCLHLANLCRRTGLIVQGMKILTPIIQSNYKRTNSSPTPKEKAEYAMLLARAGSSAEAHKILENMDPKDVPNIHFYRSMILFHFWDYQKAIPELKAHIASASTEHSQLLGQLNLAAALIWTGERTSVENVLAIGLERARAHKNARLQATAYEMQAQLLIEKEEYEYAEIILNRAQEIFSQSENFDQLFVRIWQAYLASIRVKDTTPLFMVRAEALHRRRFESLREIDLLCLQIRHDEKLMNHLYFGTPFEAFREKLEKTLHRAPAVDQFVYGKEGSPCLDVMTGQIDGHKSLPRATHQLVEALSRDLYKPHSIASLFGELFPAEPFNIFTSPHRIRQIVHRARMAIEKKKIPLELSETFNTYTLDLRPDFSLALPKYGERVDVISDHRPLSMAIDHERQEIRR